MRTSSSGCHELPIVSPYSRTKDAEPLSGRRSVKMASLSSRRVWAAWLLLLVMLPHFPGVEAPLNDLISRKNLMIDLGDGVTTEAQITYPLVASGPFPGVLLVPGSGACNMDEHIPEGTATGEPVRPFLQIAEFLSLRGFAVLRYNKRGVDLNYTDIDMDLALNWTYPVLKSDAERALAILMGQNEVDPDDITIIGHSEGSFLTSLVAAENPNVKKIVLMGLARHPREVAYWQLIELKMTYAEDVLDGDDDGLISIQDAKDTFGSDTLVTISPYNLIENTTGEWRWYPGIDQDGDGYFNITGELRPLLLQSHEYITTVEYPGSKLVQSSNSVDSMMDIMGGVPASILILHGEDDILTPPREAFILEQMLTGARHPDHTMIIYPGLSHYFYPSNGYSMAIGPIQSVVLSDIAAWLGDPTRNVRYFEEGLRKTENTTAGLREQFNVKRERDAALESQLGELFSESSDVNRSITEILNHNDELQRTLNSLRNLSYIALGVSFLVVGIAARVKTKDENSCEMGELRH